MKALRTQRRWLLGFSMTEILAVSAIVTSIPAAQYAKAKQKALQTTCVHNLKQIGQMLVMYHMSEGKYPDAVFFPKDALGEEKSIVNLLEAVPKEMWLCPSAPPELRQRGLTFVYNEKYGGRRSLKNPGRAWMLVEVNCVSKAVRPPHPGGYNVLCADGQVYTISASKLPKSIRELQTAALERMEERVHGGRLAALPASDRGEGTPVRAPVLQLPVAGAATVAPLSLRSGSDRGVGNVGLRESTFAFHAGGARSTGRGSAPVAGPRVAEVHPEG